MLTSIKPKYDGDLSRVVILVDYSNLLYRSYFSSITSLQERPWLPILRFLDSLRLCVQRSKIDGTPLEIVFAGESKTPLIRSELDPTYKAQRSHLTDSAFQQVRGNIEKIVSDLGFEILNRDGYEADDIIASFVKKSCHQCRCKVRCANCEHKSEYDTDIVVYSNDRDMNQLLSFDRCDIYRNAGIHTGVFYTREDFEKDFGFSPLKFDRYKAMVGDKSDNIKGVDGFGPVTAKEYVLEDKTPIDISYAKALELVQLFYEIENIPDHGTDISNLEKSVKLRANSLLDIAMQYGPDKLPYEEVLLSVQKFREVCKTLEPF